MRDDEFEASRDEAKFGTPPEREDADLPEWDSPEVPVKDYAPDTDRLTCCCESHPPEFGGPIPDRDCPVHGDADTDRLTETLAEALHEHIDGDYLLGMMNQNSHRFAGWQKTPSRRGGLARAKCTCGWKGQPEYAPSDYRSNGQFDQHAALMAAVRIALTEQAERIAAAIEALQDDVNGPPDRAAVWLSAVIEAAWIARQEATR